MHGIYLDNNTTTRPGENSVAKMLPFLTERWGVSSAPHRIGQQLMPAIDEALRGIYALLGAKESDSVIFTSSAAEAVNHVILSTYFDVTVHTGKNQFITSKIDEAPSIMAIGRLEQLSCLGKMAVPDRSGRITAQAIIDEMTPRTALVSLSWANGLTGVINPIQEIADVCQERGVLLHLDVSHALGKLVCNWSDIPVHFLSFSGDNFHAPTGTGGLYIRGDVKCSPFILGGIEQAGYRAGNFNTGALAALGQAARDALDARDLLCTEIARLRGKLEMDIKASLSDAVPLFQDQERIPNTSVIAFPGVSNEALLYLLNRKGVYASIGGGTYQQVGLILEACGIERTLAHSAISFGLSRETTEDEIDRAVEIIVGCVKSLQHSSQKCFEPKLGTVQ